MLKLTNLYFTVPDAQSDSGRERNIVEDLSYTFERGKFYAITGPNGSGKTTIAKLVMGLNPVTSGTIALEGQDITNMPITERAKLGIAYSFQHPARFKGLTFRDLLSIAMGSDDEDKMVELIQRVGICSLSFLDQNVGAKLSGGEIKKIELATTIARNPKIAIYDEPDTGIDLWTIDPMVKLLKREQECNKTTTIVVSHNRAFLEAADVVLILNHGKFEYEGDLKGAMPFLSDMRTCSYTKWKEDLNAKCFR